MASAAAAAAAAAARMVTVAQKAGLPLSAGQASHFLRELARPGVAAWDSAWDAPLAFLCAEVRRMGTAVTAGGGGGGGGGTVAEAATALKAVTVCHTRLSAADKEATLDALEARLAGAGGSEPEGRAARRLPAPVALSVLVSTARAHRANYPLCLRAAASVLDSVDGDLSRLSHDAFASLLYALPRHGVTALSDPELVACCDAAAVAAFGSDGDLVPEAATASSLARVLGGAAALPLPALAAVARACARALVEEERVFRAVTAQQAEVLAAVFEAEGLLAAGSALDGALRRAAEASSGGGPAPTRKHPLPPRRVLYGFGQEWVPVPVPLQEKLGDGSFGHRELMRFEQRHGGGGGGGGGPSSSSLRGDVEFLVSAEALALLQGPELCRLLHLLAEVRNAREAVAGGGGGSSAEPPLLCEETLQRLRDAALRLPPTNNPCDVALAMAAATALFTGKAWTATARNVVTALGERFVDAAAAAAGVAATAEEAASVSRAHVAAAWALGTARGDQGVVRAVLTSAAQHKSPARAAIPLLWAAARVRAGSGAAVQAVAQAAVSEESRGGMTPATLGLTVWALARLQVRLEDVPGLMEQAVRMRVPERGSVEIVSMCLYAVQITGILHKAFLDGLCARVVRDPAVGRHVCSDASRPKELVQIFMSMRYYNSDFLTWLRARLAEEPIEYDRRRPAQRKRSRSAAAAAAAAAAARKSGGKKNTDAEATFSPRPPSASPPTP